MSDTPMQKQYDEIKGEYKDAIVLFRLGDFYEAFNDDAVELSKTLGITLTGRGKDENRKPMAGIPHHALNNYLPKLIEAGLKVAIADQTEEAVPGKLVERKVTKIITPGTVIDENSLDATKNNYISSLYIQVPLGGKQEFNLVYCDITTGETLAFKTDNALVLRNEINKIDSKELICAESQLNRANIIFKNRIEVLSDSDFDPNSNTEFLKEKFNIANLKGLGLEGEQGIIAAAGALIKYLEKCHKTAANHIKTIKLYQYSDFMQLDYETIRNLEILFTMSGFDNKYTLYNVINLCQTAMGKRKLRSWIIRPLKNSTMINERFEGVEYFFKDPILNEELRELLKSSADFERIAGRLGLSSANPKEIVAMKQSLISALEIIKKINQSSIELPKRVAFLIKSINYSTIDEIINLIGKSLLDDPSAAINEGNIIKDGFNSEIDDLRSVRNNIKQIFTDF